MKMNILEGILCVCFVLCFVSSDKTLTSFPPGFMLGTSTSSYQIEGGVEEGGRGVSIWDTFVNQDPTPVFDGSTANISADSYHKYKEDVQLLKNVGFDHYRFSIAWVRILPRGEISDINQEGIAYYNNLIDELIKNKIEPVVTMYHYELPQALQDLGGWANPVIADYFEDYASVLYKNFGDRVKIWITFNQPKGISEGYTSDFVAPGLSINGSGEYLAVHNVLRAHGKAYRLYERQFKQSQKGKVGITIVGINNTPLTDSEEDIQATERAILFQLEWIAHPIFSKNGDYPPLLKNIVARNSILENRTRSRLPVFTRQEIKDIKGSADFFGLNHYFSNLITANTALTGNDSFIIRDQNFTPQADPSWETQAGSTSVVPCGMRGILNDIKNRYDNPPVFITENGYGDDGRINDFKRIEFFNDYITEMLKAIYMDKCNVIGFTAWSLLDNFEFTLGYIVKYGIYNVDFNSTERVRTPKLSAFYFKEMLKTRRVPNLITSKSFKEQ